MTMPRSLLVDLELTRYYHCISRCVRQAFLCGDKYQHRKQWIEERLEKLTEQFAVSVSGFAVMDNHLHVLVRLDPERGQVWDSREVLRRWIAVFPPKHLDLEDAKIVANWVAHEARDKKKVEILRKRLQNLGWFMKALKEPLARLANKEDNCRGTFWEGRYKSIAILDSESLLATCAYIDLNPVAAGFSVLPENSPHTSLRQRVIHARKCGELDNLRVSAERGSVMGSRAVGRMEDSHWLCPLEDARLKGSEREGMLESFSLGSYLQLIDYTSRIHRLGKAQVPAGVAGIFKRLGTSSEYWEQLMRKLFRTARVMGGYFSVSRQQLKKVAEQKGRHHLDNVVPIVMSS